MSAERAEIQAQIQANVAGVAHYIDAKEWPALRALFADEVETDYTSLFGGAPQRTAADALIEGWRTLLAAVVTQHLLGPVVVSVTGDRAEARCHVRALHIVAGAASGDTWEVLGHYLFDLTRREGDFRITRLKLETYHQIGNPRLLSEAQARP